MHIHMNSFIKSPYRLLTSSRYNVDEEIAKAIAEAVWNTSRNIRESIRIARISKSVEDVKWLATVFLSN